MSMTHITRIIPIPSLLSVSKGPIRPIPLYNRRASTVTVIRIPAPASADEFEGAGCTRRISESEVGLDFEAGNEGGYVAWEFGGFGADGRPVLCERCGDVLGGLGGGWNEVEEDGHAVCVLGVEGGQGGVIAEGAVGGVETVGENGCLKGGGARRPSCC